MKKWIAFICVLTLLCSLFAFPALADGTRNCVSCGRSIDADNVFCPYCGEMQFMMCPNCSYRTADSSDVFCPRCGSRLVDPSTRPLVSSSSTSSSTASADTQIYGLASERLATRSGPSTDYTELGTYKVKGEYVRIVTIAYDENGVGWIQCEVTYGGALRRVYTGLKRFDTSTFNLSQVPDESQVYGAQRAYIDLACTLRYGPGSAYGVCKDTLDSYYVDVLTVENGWALVLASSNNTPCRVWVEDRVLSYY